MYKNVENGEDVSGSDLLNDLMDSIKALSDIGVTEIEDMFFTNGSIDPSKLSKYLNEQLTSRNANKVLLDMIQSYIDPETKLVTLPPLSATSDASWIESIVISTVNKHVIDITTPGSSFVQRSVFAIENGEGEGSIQSDVDMDKTINGGKRLEMINEDGSMDAVISINFFDDILPKKPMSFEEKRQWLINNGIIGPNTKANTIGYRIPTQAQSSIHALRFVDVVPAVKDTIILPEEFTKITGSDFDIDHLYLARLNYTFGEDGIMTSAMEENSKEYH